MHALPSHRSDPQKVPESDIKFLENVPFYMSTFWADISPVGIQQDAETSTGPSREMGMCLVAYIDDTLILAESKETALDHVKGMVYLLECLGFVINKDKLLLLLSQTMEFLGLMIDSVNMELLLLLHKIKMIRTESRKLLKDGTTMAHALTHLLGKMNTAACVIPPAPLFITTHRWHWLIC